MESNLYQDFTLWLSTIYENMYHFFNQQEVSASMVIILVLALLCYTITQIRKVNDLPTIKIEPSKSIEKYEKIKHQQKDLPNFGSLEAQKNRKIQQLAKVVFKNSVNDKRKSKVGTKQFFEKKSMLRSSFLKLPQSKLSNKSIEQKQEEERKRIAQEQSQKKVQIEAKKQQPKIQEKQLKIFPSFNSINIPSNKTFDFTQSFAKKPVIEKAQQNQKHLFDMRPADKTNTVVVEQINQPKNNQTTNSNNSFNLFGNSQPSLFTQDPLKLTPQINKATNPPAKSQTNAPQLFVNTPTTQLPNNLLNVTNNNIQNTNQLNVTKENINQENLRKQDTNIENVPKQNTALENTSQENKSNPPNIIKIPEVPKKQQPIIPVSKPVQIKISMDANPVRPQPSLAVKPKQKLNSQDLLDSYIKFVDNIKQELKVTSKVQNLLGARSSPNVILIQAKSLLVTIDKNDDKQVTALALKIYQTFVYNFISTSNIKSGLERIPSRQKTKQCEKNAINAYILILNMYRLMDPVKKIWVIVFGKVLKMLSFLYKRKEDLQSYHKLELIQCNYIKKYKDVHSKYVSRIDFLTYFLLGLTAFDPIIILKQVETKERDVQASRVEIQSWGKKWSYSQFWSLVHAVLNNKHESYFKPVFFMNLLYVLFPRVYQYKLNQVLFKQEYELYLIVIKRAKNYMNGYDKMKEVKILSETYEDEEYEYDGDDLVKSIKVLESRFVEKQVQIKMKVKDFENRTNVFYYFTKEK